HALQFDYQTAFGQLPDAYETLLRDVMIGDQTLFVSADFTESAWCLYDPLLQGQKSVHFYTAASWGPREADALLERHGHRWQLGWQGAASFVSLLSSENSDASRATRYA